MRLSATIYAILMCLLAVPRADAHVTLTYPTGGESFVPGDTVIIEWEETIPHDQNDWDLYFSADGGATWEPIALDLPVADRSYEWTVPGVSASNAVVRVVQDNKGRDYESVSGHFAIMSMATGSDDVAAPTQFELLPAAPNPFRTATSIRFVLPREAHATLDVFDLLGRHVARLADERFAAGLHRIQWEAADVPNGIYLYRVTAGGHSATGRVVAVD